MKAFFLFSLLISPTLLASESIKVVPESEISNYWVYKTRMQDGPIRGALTKHYYMRGGQGVCANVSFIIAKDGKPLADSLLMLKYTVLPSADGATFDISDETVLQSIRRDFMAKLSYKPADANQESEPVRTNYIYGVSLKNEKDISLRESCEVDLSSRLVELDRF